MIQCIGKSFLVDITFYKTLRFFLFLYNKQKELSQVTSKGVTLFLSLSRGLVLRELRHGDSLLVEARIDERPTSANTPPTYEEDEGCAGQEVKNFLVLRNALEGMEGGGGDGRSVSLAHTSPIVGRRHREFRLSPKQKSTQKKERGRLYDQAKRQNRV